MDWIPMVTTRLDMVTSWVFKNISILQGTTLGCFRKHKSDSRRFVVQENTLFNTRSWLKVRNIWWLFWILWFCKLMDDSPMLTTTNTSYGDWISKRWKLLLRCPIVPHFIRKCSTISFVLFKLADVTQNRLKITLKKNTQIVTSKQKSRP